MMLGTANVSLKEQDIGKVKITLPPFSEQRRVVARIDYIVKKIEEARSVRHEAQIEQQRLLMAAYYRMAANAPRRALGDVAPLIRRPVAIDSTVSYPRIAVRSFGRGTFHKPPLVGSEVTWQKMFQVNAGDLLISNIKAWEGAIAVTSPEDAGRFGSHRYLTFVPHPQKATARFICFHLLTPEGLSQVGEASPGSADRNRTLGATKLLQTLVPVPPIEEQLWFDQITFQLDAMQRVQTESATVLDALLPAVLDHAFE
jgi:type I restriction enzyme S subunit